MAKLADAPDLGSGGAIRAGSSPVTRICTISRRELCSAALLNSDQKEGHPMAADIISETGTSPENRQTPSVTRKADTITLHQISSPSCVSMFLDAVKDAVRSGYQEITICSPEEPTIFPNACVPICGIIEHYRQEGISFSFDTDPGSFFSHCGLMHPFTELPPDRDPLNLIFRYGENQVADITQAYIDTISHITVCEEGVLTSLIWCINEVMDNVLVHSQQQSGYVMAQFHPSTNHIAFCIYDSGIGIYNSLRSSSHSPQSEADAIMLSMREGVGDGLGQGNGLYGLYQIVKENGGRLRITSGATALDVKDGMRKILKKEIPFIDDEHRSTTVDFQLDLGKRVNITEAFQSIGGFDGFDIRIDNMLTDDNYVNYDVVKEGQGTATRIAGASIRNDIENTLKRTNKGIILDFSNARVVSSSFIDELIAKMVLDLGFVAFNNTVRLSNMTPEIRFLCERAVYLRIHDTWKAGKNDE